MWQDLTERTPGTGHRYAGIWPRSLALAIDLALLFALFLPITRAVKGVWIMGTGDHRWAYGPFITDPLCLAFLGAMYLYFVSLEGLAGATLGKRCLGLRVVRVDGGRPGLLKAAVRNLLRLVDGLPAFGTLGVVLVLRSEEKARFGDRVAGTRVVYTKRGAG